MANGVCRRCLRWKSSIAQNGRCWSCRAPERRKVRDRERRQLRQPPKPPYRGEAGRCSLCGVPIPRGRFTWCSALCVEVWNLASRRDHAVAHIAKIDGSACAVCGGADEPLGYQVELDHRRPLWSLSEAERNELRWWLPFNLWLLGPRCHRAKTRREAAARAVVRRAEAEGRQVRYLGDPGPEPSRLFG